MAVQNHVTGVGRIVWGKPGIAVDKKDQTTKQVVIKDGKPVQEWKFGLAIPKAEFIAKTYPLMMQEAQSAYPQGIPPNFSWKFKDGDGVDRQGKPYNQREGYAGCYVLAVSSGAFAPPMYKFENGVYRQITADEIKCGDYAAVNLNFKVNVPGNVSHTPGLYVNPNGVVFVAYGTPIVTSADPDEMFGGQQFALPPGASATPLAPTAPMPGLPGQAPQPQPYNPVPAAAPMQPQGYPPQQPAGMMHAGYVQPVAPAAYPPPAHDFVHNAGQPQPYNPVPAAAPMQPQGYPPQQPAGIPGAPYGMSGQLPGR